MSKILILQSILLDDKRVRDKVTPLRYMDNWMMMMMRLQLKKVDLVIVQIYMPRGGVADEVKETYDKIEEIVEKEKGACVILMGDWNAVVGKGEEGSTVGSRATFSFKPEPGKLGNAVRRHMETMLMLVL